LVRPAKNGCDPAINNSGEIAIDRNYNVTRKSGRPEEKPADEASGISQNHPGGPVNPPGKYPGKISGGSL